MQYTVRFGSSSVAWFRRDFNVATPQWFLRKPRKMPPTTSQHYVGPGNGIPMFDEFESRRVSMDSSTLLQHQNTRFCGWMGRDISSHSRFRDFAKILTSFAVAKPTPLMSSKSESHIVDLLWCTHICEFHSNINSENSRSSQSRVEASRRNCHIHRVFIVCRWRLKLLSCGSQKNVTLSLTSDMMDLVQNAEYTIKCWVLHVTMINPMR